MTARPRVLIADDHHPIRVGVRLALEEGGCDVVAEAETAFQAVELANEVRPDACILDVAMPGGGLWALRTILDQRPTTRCLMLTISEDSSDVLDALELGAVGYLLKDVAPHEVPRAVHAAMSGEAVLDGQLTAVVLGELRRGPRADVVINAEGRKVAFTPREWEVLDLLLGGLSTREIAERLVVRPITVRRHVSDIVAKLRVSSRGEAVELLRGQHSAHRHQSGPDT
ncbi:MAG: response regulator transcription factor [Actinomycetota bacterium]|nr:response regulator transcription factor [Actinomycetota bacterium]